MWMFKSVGLFALISLAKCAPYTPKGGLGTNSTPPVYAPQSDFDFQSLNLALNQEYIELDLFHYALAKFSKQEFYDAGLSDSDLYLIEYMADQEVGHATLISNMLGPKAAKACNYTYPFQTVPEFFDFSQKLTRWGESGVFGFLAHLNSRPAANLLVESIAVESRQQLIFRQFEGIFSMPEWFEVGITQSMAWTLLSRYITRCPADNPHIEFQNFPALNITNNPNATNLAKAAISNNITALSAPDMVVNFSWESPGKKVSYDQKYTTNTTAGKPKYVAWISQLNTTYTPLTNISGNTGSSKQPGGKIFGNNTAPLLNGTMFALITDDNPYVTPFNLTMLNKHVVAGPAVYQAG